MAARCRRRGGAVWMLAGLSACLEVDPSFMGSTGTGSGATGTDGGSTGGPTATGTGAGGTASGSTGGTTTVGSTGGACVAETCNDLDDDCDGLVDEVGADNTDCGSCTLEQFQDHAYWFCGTDQSWTEARDQCLARGAALVSIPDDTINAFLASHLGNMFGNEFWTGGNDRGEENTWVWEDGTPWGFENWAMNEPNDSTGEDCVQMWSVTPGTWNDEDCGAGDPFVCWAPHAG